MDRCWLVSLPVLSFSLIGWNRLSTQLMVMSKDAHRGVRTGRYMVCVHTHFLHNLPWAVHCMDPNSRPEICSQQPKALHLSSWYTFVCVCVCDWMLARNVGLTYSLGEQQVKRRASQWEVRKHCLEEKTGLRVSEENRSCSSPLLEFSTRWRRWSTSKTNGQKQNTLTSPFNMHLGLRSHLISWPVAFTPESVSSWVLIKLFVSEKLHYFVNLIV